MNSDRYLARIGYSGPTAPTAETLKALQQAHLLAVPFENLDVYLKRPILLDTERLFAKVVGERRGGFCYELNGLFAVLLRSLGFQVDLLSARVRNGSGGFGAEYDHLALHVRGSDGQSYLADVGFGESCRVPLRLVPEEVQHDGLRAYRIISVDDALVLEEQNDEGAWQAEHRFTLQPRRFEEFTAMCQYHQTSPETSFTQRRICTLARPDGRITLSDLRLITTTNSVREERLLDDEDAWRETLHRSFGITLPTG